MISEFDSDPDEKTPPLIEWSDEHKLDLPQIDDEHRAIVDLLNRLNHVAMEGGYEPSLIEQLLEEVETRVSQHFATEEHLFQSTGFPRMKEHRLAHEEFVSALALFVRELKAARISLRPMLIFIKGWFMEHTQHTDREFIRYLKFIKHI